MVDASLISTLKSLELNENQSSFFIKKFYNDKDL